MVEIIVKVCKGITEENLKNEINEVIKHYELVYPPHYLEVNNAFILYYKEQNKTQISEEEFLMKTPDIRINGNKQLDFRKLNFNEILRQYWYIALIIGLVIFYYLFIK